MGGADDHDRSAQDPKTPERRCLATRRVLPKAAMIRFVVGPEGLLVPDLAGRLPGRGLWVSANRAALGEAAAKNLFAKAAKQSVTLPADLVGQVEGLLRRRLLDLIGLARRAGEAVSGFDRVEAWLREGRAQLLIGAADGAPDGRRKLTALAGERRVLNCFTADELAQAFGRDRVVHAAIAAGGLAQQIEAETARLAGFVDQSNDVSVDSTQ